MFLQLFYILKYVDTGYPMQKWWKHEKLCIDKKVNDTFISEREKDFLEC